LLNTERWKNFARNAFFCSSDAAYMRARISKSSQMIDTAQRAESSTRANARPRANSADQLAVDDGRAAGAATHRCHGRGVTPSFVKFNDELPLLIKRVLPLPRQAGLRQA
jgi:hypothetical protein